MEKIMKVIPIFILKLLNTAHILDNFTNYELERRFAIKLIRDFDNVIENIKRNRTIMVIDKMQWKYDFFNIAFLNNAMSFILYSLYSGCIPMFSIN